MARGGFVGAKAHIARLKKLRGPEATLLVGKALFAGGELIQVEAQIGISSGSVSGKNHVASSPGEFPNQDTGVLSGNIETVQVEPLLVEVSSNAPYSTALEFGTSKMSARPFMAPSRDAKRDEVQQLVRRAVATAVKRSRSRG